MADFDSPKGNGLSFNGQNLSLILMVALLVGALIMIGWLVNSKSKLEKDSKTLENNYKNLESENQKNRSRLETLDAEALKMTKELEDLRTQKEKLITSRDSIARLLAYSRVNERNSQVKIAQLQKKLNELQTRLTDVQKRYDEALASAGTTDSELRRQVELLTAERNALAAENQKLQRDLQSATGNADNRTAIFASKMRANPGELSKGKFSASKRSQNIDRVEVTFTLSRAPKPTESLIFKIYDRTNKEIAVKPKYRNELNSPANPTNQKVILEFESGKLGRKASGTYSVRLFMTDVNKGLENQEIGITQFEAI
jgi:chromosome segregation ATPase